MVSDLALQVFGVAVFLIPVFLGLYSLRWFRSRPISSPYAKTVGAVALVTFLSGFIGLLPWSIRWKGVIPSEGLLGRIVADALIHYFNLVGAYLVCLAVIAVALVSFDGVLVRRHADLVADAASHSSTPRSIALPTGAWNAPARRQPRNWRRSAPPPPMPSRW